MSWSHFKISDVWLLVSDECSDLYAFVDPISEPLLCNTAVMCSTWGGLWKSFEKLELVLQNIGACLLMGVGRKENSQPSLWQLCTSPYNSSAVSRCSIWLLKPTRACIQGVPDLQSYLWLLPLVRSYSVFPFWQEVRTAAVRNTAFVFRRLQSRMLRDVLSQSICTGIWIGHRIDFWVVRCF